MGNRIYIVRDTFFGTEVARGRGNNSDHELQALVANISTKP